MWHATLARAEPHPIFAAGICILMAIGIGHQLYYHLWMLPTGVRRWAAAQGFEVVGMRKANVFDTLKFTRFDGRVLYFIHVRDDAGDETGILAWIGPYNLFRLSPDHCRIEAMEKASGSKKGLPFQGIAFGRIGKALANAIPIPTQVLGLALADFMLAFIAMSFTLLITVPFIVHVGRSLFALSAGGARGMTIEGFFNVLVVIATMTTVSILLAVGGVGLLRRRTWGYVCHLAGAAGVGFSIIGIVYSIPAIFIALLPGFRRYCCGERADEKPIAFLDEL